MNLRTSCFNSAVFRSDVKRLWWVPALHTLSIFLLCLLPLYIDFNKSIGMFAGTDSQYINSVLLNYSPVPYLILAVLTVGLSALLFSYLNSKSAVATMHSVPVKRKTLYITHIIFGMVALILPILINGGILVLMRSNPQISQAVSMSHIGAWISTQIGYALVGFAFSVFIGMFTGNSVAHLVFTYIFAMLPFFVEMAFNYIMTLNLYGYVQSYQGSLIVRKFLYFSVDKLTEPMSFLIYIIYTLVLFAVGYLVYKIRNLEHNSEVVAFPKLKPLFVYGVSICFGIAGYFYLASVLNISNLFFAIPFGLLGLIIANMLTKKAFTLKGTVKPAAAFILSITALFLVFHFDITGFEKRVPDASTVESVSVTSRPADAFKFRSSVNGRMVVPQTNYVPLLTEQDDIENVLRFHSYKTVERIEEPNDSSSYLYVNYSLKDGKTMLRRYPVDYDDDQEYIKPIMETPENLQYRFPILNSSTQKDIVSVSIEDVRLKNAFDMYYMEKATDTDIANRLIEALKADLAQTTYEAFIYENFMPTTIAIEYELPLVYEGTDTLVTDQNTSYNDLHTYYIRPSYTNTIALLTELGFYDVLPKASDYQSIEVWYSDNQAAGAVITDPAQIEEIYNYVTATQANLKPTSNSVITLTFLSDTQQEFTVTRTQDDANMPPALQNLF